MQRELELQKEIPLAYEADIVVVGGGLTGVCAAVSAAREGKRVVLIEQGSCGGGMATQGLVGPFMTSYDKSGEIMVIRGLFEELVCRLEERGGAIHPAKVRAGTAFTSWIRNGHDHVTPFDPEILKKLIDDLLTESGVEVLYHTTFIEPVMDGKRILGVIVHSKKGFQEIRGNIVIDCTGDGDVAYRCGAPYELGDPERNSMQPATLFFRIGNVDSKALEAEIQANLHNFYRKDGVNYRSLHWRVSEARENGDWTIARASVGMYRGVKEDEWSINTSRMIGVDGTDNKSLSDAEIIGRRQVEEIFSFLKKYVPGCQNARLLSSASTVGIRETRHIFGEYVMTVEDVLHGTVPEDSILVASNSVDIHARYGAAGSEYLSIEHGEWYGIPYRCLVPLEVEHLLIAGRCISATSDAAGAFRVMPPCTAMGQAAGIAAAVALETGAAPRTVDFSLVKERLLARGAFLGT